MKLPYLKILIISFLLMLGLFAHIISKKNDSPLEQAAEAILEAQGIDIDFSPDDTE